MHLLLRADSDASIGAGHVMRSLALGRRWIAGGGLATLLGRVESERLRQRVSDAGVVLLRKVFREQLEKIERGDDPMAVVRDPARNRIIDVPREHKAHYTISGDFYAKERAVEISGQW